MYDAVQLHLAGSLRVCLRTPSMQPQPQSLMRCYSVPPCLRLRATRGDHLVHFTSRRRAASRSCVVCSTPLASSAVGVQRQRCGRAHQKRSLHLRTRRAAPGCARASLPARAFSRGTPSFKRSLGAGLFSQALRRKASFSVARGQFLPLQSRRGFLPHPEGGGGKNNKHT